MIKKHPVSSGIIGTLLITIGVTTYQYDKDVDDLNQQLEKKSAQYGELSIQYKDAIEVVGRQEGEIHNYKDKIIEINNDKKELNKDLANKNNSIKKQKESIDSLKEQLEVAKKRNRESP